jgi:MoaA/NifB/PqqE/SkfB family radical SAM enzyme
MLAQELGVECTLDPTITPMMDGDRSVLSLGLKQEALRQVFRDKELVGDVDEFCTVAAPADENELSALPCSAGHTTCYVSPYGDVFPCVQFPLPTGNVRNERFVDIWRHSERMNEVRSIRLKDVARGVRGWRLWRAICAGRHRRTAKSPSPAPEFRRLICWRRNRRHAIWCRFA